MITAQAEASVSTFPAEKVERCIRDELAQAAKDRTVLHRQSEPGETTTRNRAPSVQLEIDSLTVVEVLCAIEEVTEFEIPDEVVRAGGYDTVDQVVADLMPKVEQRWRQHRKESPK